MLRALTAFTGFARAVASLMIASIVAVAGWLGYQAYSERDAKWEKLVAEQQAKIEQLEEEKRELETRNRLLKVDHRVARIDVVDQTRGSDGRVITKVHYVELDDEGKPLQSSREFTLEGEDVWIDAWVVKFKDELVETAHPLQGRSIYWLRGIFGEHEAPSSAQSLDQPGLPPLPYRSGDNVSDFERNVWERFWEIARDPEKLNEIGARAAGGEGPHQRVRKGERWRVELRSSGGLSFVPDGQIPAPPQAPI